MSKASGLVRLGKCPIFFGGKVNIGRCHEFWSNSKNKVRCYEIFFDHTLLVIPSRLTPRYSSHYHSSNREASEVNTNIYNNLLDYLFLRVNL